MPSETLSQNRLEIWYASCADIDAATFNHAETQILSPEERERMHRFRQAADQRLHLTARLLLRSMLAAFTGVAAADWRFRFNDHGKPQPEEGFPQVRFNLSHSNGLAICAIHPSREVGVDVEPLDRRIGSSTAASVLSEGEWQCYSETQEEQKPEVFIKYWVLKEAYLKAIGKGLSLPLTDFSFEFDKAGKPQLSSTNTEEDQVKDWLFFEFQPAPGYAAAAAIGGEVDQPVAVALNVRPFTP